jgi:hypothetical protein
MTRDDIINLARQHGKLVQEKNAEVEYLLTLEGVNALLAAEREACATACEEFYSIEWLAQHCAAAIRARSQA